MEIKSNSKYSRLFLCFHPCHQIFFFFKDIILVEKIDIFLFNLFVRIYLLLYDCNLMLSDGEYNLLTYSVDSLVSCLSMYNGTLNNFLRLL